MELALSGGENHRIDRQDNISGNDDRATRRARGAVIVHPIEGPSAAAAGAREAHEPQGARGDGEHGLGARPWIKPPDERALGE